MDAVLECCCGLDIHRDQIVACILKGPLDCQPIAEVRSFSAFQHGLQELKSWIEQEECHHVAMESTGVYWKPAYTMLEEAFDGDIRLLLVNARHMRNVPGRKTDVKDAQWIASLLRAGLLKGSFIPDNEIRELRDLTRYRKTMVEEVSTQKNRIEKFLQSSGFKLSTFMSDVFGASGRGILEYLTEHGEISIDTVEILLKGTLRKKKQEVALAVNGKLNKHQQEFLSMQLKHLSQLEQNVQEINSKIECHLAKYDQQVKFLEGVPGISTVAASAIIGEIGIDMSAFPKAENICSWAGVTPGCNESAGKKKSTRITHGNAYIKRILCEIAWTVTRQRGTYLSNWYWKVKQRRGSKKAIIALARKLLIIIYTILRDNVPYNAQSSKEVQQQKLEKRSQKMIRELNKQGYIIELQPNLAG